MQGRSSIIRVFAALVSFISLAAAQIPMPAVRLSQSHESGIYDLNEKVIWTATRSDSAGADKYAYVIRKNNLDLIQAGDLTFIDGAATIEAAVSEPAMLYLEITPASNRGANAVRRPIVAGAAVAPTKLQPVVPRPEDFDAFWVSRIKQLKEIPEDAVLTPKDVGVSDIEYSIVRMDHVNNTHVYGQIARPKQGEKFPALVIFQWASPPYPLHKEWITGYAQAGWLVLNIEPHDVLPDQPQKYYDNLPTNIKRYEAVGNDDRDKCFFGEMYLRDYRAVDYIASRPDWDGTTLVAMGASMGGQQALAVAGLHPKITHVLANVPAGCDTNAALHGRQAGYPAFPSDNPRAMAASRYFDVVNFAPRIRAKTLVAMGFVDTVCPPAGIWTAFNQIAAPKEVAPMLHSPHNHQATTEQLKPWTTRSNAWLESILKTGDVTPLSDSTWPRNDARPALYDHQSAMDQLGVKSLCCGPDGFNMNDGTRVTSAKQPPRRRATYFNDLDRELYGPGGFLADGHR